MVSFKDILMKHPAPETTATETATPTKETTTAATATTTAVKKPILRVVEPRQNNNNIDINTNTNTSDANHDDDDNDTANSDYRCTKSSHNRETKGKMRPDEARRLAWTMQKKDMQRKQQRR